MTSQPRSDRPAGPGRARVLRPVAPGASAGADEQLTQGLAALAVGQWAKAAAALRAAAGQRATDDDRRATALEGLADALWWLGQADEALATREQAYAVWRLGGDDSAAARAAAWLAREYEAGVGNHAAAQGWMARAETLAVGSSDPSAAGWLGLARALLAPDPTTQAAAAAEAVERARAARDPELEVLALGRLGLAQVGAGDVAAGLRAIDEAMAAATGGETDLSTLAALCCDLLAASELSGEVDRFSQWSEVVGSLAARHGHPPLVAFCATCCAETFTSAGDWQSAERELRTALESLRASGHTARCVPPAAKLAALLTSQGRLEEAEQVLAGHHSDDTLLSRARLALARGDATAAALLTERHCRRLGGDSLLTAPAIALLVQAQLAAGDLESARAAAARLQAVAAASGHRRTLGRAALARARVAAAAGDRAAEARALEEALDELSSVAPEAIETAEARLQLARLHAADAPKLAVAEARSAIAVFEAAGAAHAVDAAAALLRSLGDRSRVGAKDRGTLTDRERQVLRLVGQGLTNGEIAQRLFISPKTAGNHVSSLLAKLGLRSRVEAAAYAALHAED